MGHIGKKQQNYWLGAAFDIAAHTQGCNTNGYFGELTGKAYTKNIVAEADYVGMYILANSGMELDGATYFWRRMAIESPANIASGHTSTHPARGRKISCVGEYGGGDSPEKSVRCPVQARIEIITIKQEQLNKNRVI